MRIVGFDTNKTWYHEKCKNCCQDFFYASDKWILGLLLDGYYFDLEFKTHYAECINNRVERILNEKKA